MRKISRISAERLGLLREALAHRKVDGFIVPRGDQFMGEEVPACFERLAWLTGFTGSAGTAIILKTSAAVLTDGRYSIQVRQQVDPECFDTVDVTAQTLAGWLTENAAAGEIIGYDPWLHTPREIDALQERLEPLGISLCPLEENPVDKVWKDRPHPPMEAVRVWPEKYAGRSSAEKLEMVAGDVKAKGGFATILTLPDSIAWLLNARSQDIPHTPVALSYAILRVSPLCLDWFVDPERIQPELLKVLGNHVRIIGPHAIGHEIEVLAAESGKSGKPVMIDFKRSPEWFRDRLQKAGASVKDAADPCIAPKAVKTPAEQDAMDQTHERDGLALIKFLCWLDGVAGLDDKLDELAVAAKLEAFRREEPLYRGPSFPTISGYGPHGAIVHYRATEKSAIRLAPPGLLLLDSGGQYEDGTTDITRTVAIGDPDANMREHFTTVLKAHIAVASAVFPEGTPGAQIDAFARRPLWEEGLDYAHGTGHGVGCYLGVHEESASFSPRSFERILAGMIISNEPGYYREDEYGIRIENIVLAEKTGRVCSTGADMLKFRTISLAPVDQRLIVPDRLEEHEKKWINAYHHHIWQTYRDRVDGATAEWLRAATSSIR